MALDTTSADSAAQTYVNAMATRLSLTPDQKVAALANYKELYEHLYASLKTDIVITIATDVIATVGGPAAQAGPQVPVSLSPA